MNPLAKLTVTRQRLYKKSCDGGPEFGTGEEEFVFPDGTVSQDYDSHDTSGEKSVSRHRSNPSAEKITKAGSKIT